MSKRRRVAVTGMSVNTPLSDTLDGFLEALLAGRSAITHWRFVDTSRIYSKIGGDLSTYDVSKKLASLKARIPQAMFQRLRKLATKAPWSTRLTLLMAVDAWLDAGLLDASITPDRIGAIIAGHNINCNYQYANRVQFADEPDYMDPMLSLSALDTDHGGCISETLQVHGPVYTVGAACASGNAGLRAAIDEIRHHAIDAMIVAGAVLDFSEVELHAMALMGAISFQHFNDEPHRASRPWDTRREGFVPAHGGAALVLESLDDALARGARIYAEVVEVETSSDGNHLPQPSEDGQARLMQLVLRRCRLQPEDVDYVSAHATSTPLGDLTEIRSIKRVFGDHAYRLKINATKSMLGHTCWASAAVETVAAILQINAGVLHPSINIDRLEPEVDLDVCREGAVRHAVRYAMKNSFGFGGLNSVAVLKKHEDVP